MGLARGANSWIISVGNEILIGRVLNTNAQWIGRKLTLLGYRVSRIIVVPDDIEDIVWAFRLAVENNLRVVVSTGGLGPTFDDKTAEGLSASFSLPLEVNREALEMVKKKYYSRGLELTEARAKMARLPKNAKPIPNPVGTAPGIYLVVDNTHIFALPGVPSEMKAMFEEYVEPILRKIGPKIYFAEATLVVKGVPESAAAPVIESVMKSRTKIYIKSHPRGHELGEPVLELHITASSPNPSKALSEVEDAVKLLMEKLGNKSVINVLSEPSILQ